MYDIMREDDDNISKSMHLSLHRSLFSPRKTTNFATKSMYLQHTIIYEHYGWVLLLEFILNVCYTTLFPVQEKNKGIIIRKFKTRTSFGNSWRNLPVSKKRPRVYQSERHVSILKNHEFSSTARSTEENYDGQTT